MLPATEQYAIVGIVWVIFFLGIYFYKKDICARLKDIENFYSLRFNKLIYILIGIYLLFVILNIVRMIQHKIVPTTDYLITLGVAGLIGPIAEEIIFRGFFIGFFSDKLKFRKFHFVLWIIGVNIFFALIHNLGAINPKSVVELVKTFLLGIVLTFFHYKSRRNILYPVFIHLIFNVVLMYFILN